jgi:hypothetical protein
LKKSTIIKFFIWLLAVELVLMTVLIWPDLFSRLFNSPGGSSRINNIPTQVSASEASPTDLITPEKQIITLTWTPFRFTDTLLPTMTIGETATPTPTRSIGTAIPPLVTPTNTPVVIVNPPIALPSSTPTYKPTYTNTRIPTNTSIPPTEIPTNTEVPTPINTEETPTG